MQIDEKRAIPVKSKEHLALLQNALLDEGYEITVSYDAQDERYYVKGSKYYPDTVQLDINRAIRCYELDNARDIQAAILRMGDYMCRIEAYDGDGLFVPIDKPAAYYMVIWDY